MRRFFTQLNIVFGLEIIAVILAATGFIPREAILFWTGLAVFYVILAPVKDALWLVVASIPLFAALPVSESLDTLADWRIILAVLFLYQFFKHGISSRLIKDEAGKGWVKETLKQYALEYLSVGFLLMAALSIAVADYRILAFKKLLFLINIFLLFLVVRNSARSKESILHVWRAAAVGGIITTAVALMQFFAVLFASLIDFWQFWASRVIDFFYGQNLSELLAYSNTWFAYYKSAPPTLRLFSIFPDSHSFAMFCLLAVPIFLCLAVFYQQRKRIKIFFWCLGGLSLFGAVFSGSRGVWISALPVAIAALYFWFKETDKKVPKQAVLSLAIFALIFFISAGYPLAFYKYQTWQSGQYSSSTISFFERAKSISDLEEASNQGRLEIWRESLVSIKNHPILGVGLGNFISVIGEDISSAKKGASAHNLYLDIAAEIGIPGLLILLLMFADILWTGWLVWQGATEPHFKLFGLIFCLYFVWILGYSFFDVVLLNDKVLLFFMAEVATLYGLRNIIYDPDKI
ncbi:MAG: O-antigen ligase family protein [Candidatus Portnoybacteria bacterium]|nr:O-antigen ligase family protein [Candidatus Portnoybacteria bacterium]MDD4983082.1 O-antigen ligase family protein [Candidatus Portnoybacteria bacterium]